MRAMAEAEEHDLRGAVAAEGRHSWGPQGQGARQGATGVEREAHC